MYSNVNGNSGSNFLNFAGIMELYAQTLVNPYTGFTLTFNEMKNVNNAIYDGMGGTDTINMTVDGDVLSLLDSSGTVMVKNVEIINASEGGDIINFAFDSLNYGNLIMRGAGGNDVLWGNNGNDTLLGAEGMDNIIGGSGNDFAFGGADDDYLDGAQGADYLAGGAGDDVLVYTADDIWSSNLTLSDLGSALFFADLIELGGKNRSYDSFHGDTQDDGTISATQGYDTLNLTSGGDVLLLVDSFSPQHGPVGSRVSYIDYIDAGAGNDVIDLTGETATPVTVDGGAGDDVLLGTAQADTLNGDDDNDSLYGAGGDDTLNGGAGDDIYYYAPGDGSDMIIESSGTDAIHFDAGIALDDLAFVVAGEDLEVHIGAAVITVQGHYAADHSGRVESLVFADGSSFDLGSYVPNEAPVAQDDAFTGTRDNVITGNVLANDTDTDSDTLSVTPQTLTTVNGGTVELLADGSFTYTPALGFIGDDAFNYTVLDGNGGQDMANVTLSVDYRSTDIVGTDGAENITGTNGNDTMFGLGGDDVLYGDDGVLTGPVKDKMFADDMQMPDLKEGANIVNLKPPGTPALGVANGNLSVDFDATATITFRKGYAGYNNSFGSFAIASDGTITTSKMEWANVKTAGIDTDHVIDLPVGANGGNFGFFIIGNGNDVNGGYAGLNVTGEGNIQFIYNYGHADAREAKITDAGNKISVVYNDGVTTKVLNGDVYFTTQRGDSNVVNEDGRTHVVSGMLDTNNMLLAVKNADLAGKPSVFTMDGITIDAGTNQLAAASDRFGVKSAHGGNTIEGTEKITVTFDQAVEKVMLSVSGIVGKDTGIDFKIWVQGNPNPIDYEFNIMNHVPCKTINLTSDMFWAPIEKIEISSIDNSSLGTESFFIDYIKGFVAGGVDTDTIRIGFEDLYNTGDADYEDVLFDLNINPVTLPDTAGGSDILDGGAGNDTLYGEGGNDLLVIGLGADRAFGGEGADIFAITLADADVDRIEDFNAVQGDTINIADVLEGYDPLASDINAFVQLVQNGANTEVRINADGDAGGAFDLAAIVLGTSVDINAIVADQSALA